MITWRLDPPAGHERRDAVVTASHVVADIAGREVHRTRELQFPDRGVLVDDLDAFPGLE